MILAVAGGAIKNVISGRGMLGKLGSVMTILFMIPFMTGGIAAPLALMFSAETANLYLLLGTAVAIGIMNLVFYHPLRTPRFLAASRSISWKASECT
ncbi:MAG: hypothetical protein HY245_10605 [Rhizobiales bacterium]|nr:hypothetical protein [Hyphomicrobiales bacterium]MBI3673847.1 hypothetical protein [Hyphomicrobiales bacterium]